jgi:hypothetical protein
MPILRHHGAACRGAAVAYDSLCTLERQPKTVGVPSTRNPIRRRVRPSGCASTDRSNRSRSVEGGQERSECLGDISRETLRTVKLLLEDRMEDECAESSRRAPTSEAASDVGIATPPVSGRLTTPLGTMPLNVHRARTHGFTLSVRSRYRRRTARANGLVHSISSAASAPAKLFPCRRSSPRPTSARPPSRRSPAPWTRRWKAFHRRPLFDDWACHFLDAVSLRTRARTGVAAASRSSRMASGRWPPRTLRLPPRAACGPQSPGEPRGQRISSGAWNVSLNCSRL